jgi:hypothetical protein
LKLLGMALQLQWPWLQRIDRILIPPRYTFFSGSPPTKNPRVKRAWPGAILG